MTTGGECGGTGDAVLPPGAVDERPRAAFVMEQHLGHRTFSENLQTHLDHRRIEPIWVRVDYDVPERWRRLPITVTAAFTGHREVRNGLRRAAADVHVFNTQVPAVLGGRTTRSRPYVVITDVTPLQYDRLAAGYGHRPDRAGPIGSIKHRWNTQTFQRAAACVGWSRWARDSIIDDYRVPADRTHVIPPGVDTARWRPGPRRDEPGMRILFVGGEFQRKGGDQLLDAFSRLPATCELTVVTRSEVPRHDRVTVVDDIVPNDPRLVALYQGSDVFVLPSLAETFGIAAAEAAASGLPVVATAVGGFSDIVNDGISGRLLTPGDDSALASCLLELHDRPELRHSMGRAARRHAVLHLDAATNAQRLIDVVASAVQGDGG